MIRKAQKTGGLLLDTRNNVTIAKQHSSSRKTVELHEVIARYCKRNPRVSLDALVERL